MSKQNFVTQVAYTNARLTAIGIPFKFVAGSSGGHPTLSLSNGSGNEQIRKGNYGQVFAKLDSESKKLIDTFCNRPVMVRIANGVEADERQYTGKTAIMKVVQRVVTESGKPAIVTLNSTYVFNVQP